jgi:purine-binding chemotaxis protein CheW
MTGEDQKLKHLAVKIETAALLEASRQFCTFLIGERRFGVDILDVQEVANVPEFTQVHHAPAQVAGVVNIRGQIVLCLDLRSIFDLPSAADLKERRLILFKSTVGEDFGILVDSVGDIVEVSEKAIEERRRSFQATTGDAALDKQSLGGGIVKGVCKLDDGLILILDSSSLLPELEQYFSD